MECVASHYWRYHGSDRVFAPYNHLSPEGKFDNGQFLDRGRTEQRHVVATGIVLIGKEANRIGENGVFDPRSSSAAEFRTCLR